MKKPFPAAALAAATALSLWAAPAPALAEEEPPAIHTYAATPGDTASERFAMTAEQVPVFVTKYSNRSNNRMHVARFASAEASPAIAVTNNAAVTSVQFYPERYYPQGSYTISGNTVTFNLAEELRYVIVRVNGSDPGLAIINDRPVELTPAPDPAADNVVDAADYVADLTGATDQTEAVAQAIDALYDDPGKDTLYFGPGAYQYAGLELRGRTKPVTIYVDEGALLKNRIQPTMVAMEPAIGIWDSANITISGRGVFDGNGFANYDTSNGGWRHDAATSQHQGGAMIVRSENIVFNDTLVRDAKQWNWETHTAKDVVLNNIKGLTPYEQPWIDGINLASGQDITVDGALTLGNDDVFASGHYNPNDAFEADGDRLNWDTGDTFGIVVSNTLGWSSLAGNGLRIGHAAYGNQLKDYTFDNFHAVGFSSGNIGLRVQNPSGSTKDTYPKYESFAMRNSSFDTSRVATNISLLGRASSDPADRIGEVVLENICFSKLNSATIQNVAKLTIRDLCIAGQKVSLLSQSGLAYSNVVSADIDMVADSAPVISAIANQVVVAGEAVAFTVLASDPDGEAVALSASGLPDAAVFDPATGQFAWTPDASQAGLHTLTFTATDTSGAKASRSVQIRVTLPEAPETGNQVHLAAGQDTYAASWGAQSGYNYGANPYLRALKGSAGALGQGAAGGASNDVKLMFLEFDLSDYAGQLDRVAKAELRLTYFGFTKAGHVCSGCTDTIKVALAEPGWVEGDGRDTTSSYTASTIAGSLTWDAQPALDESQVIESGPFDISASAIIPNEKNYSNSSRPVGTVASADVTALLGELSADGVLSLAVNETAGKDIIFVSQEGARSNSNAAGLGPKLTLTLETDTSALAELVASLDELGRATGEEYTEASWLAFQEAWAAAQAVLDDEDATQNEADAALQALAEAVDALEAAPPALDVAVAVTSRCIASKVYLTVTARNGEQEPLALEIATDYGAKAFAAIAPGKYAAHAFTARLVNLPAGQVVVTASTGGDQPVVAQQVGAYGGLTC
ncbi:MAG: putative Ig domain-containing protein [Bifidobacteriaceae bacterium]|jgi:hypothetical protein|nr:putative Ig domain-containing protein [Bifidobacteriaceae bacterium]